MLRRVMVGAWAVAALSLGACADDVFVDLRLLHAPDLDPLRDFSSVRLSVIDEDGRIVFDDRAPGPDAADGAFVTSLTAGARYTALLSADAAEACPVRGRAVGRSAPFVHDEQSYPVPIAVGCADEVSAAPDIASRRVGHQLVPLDDGGALAIAGTAFLDPGRVFGDILAPRDAVISTQRYDPARAEFVSGGPLLLTGVAYPSVVTTHDDRVITVGGVTPCDGACTTAPFTCPSVLQELGAPPVPLPVGRCLPAAVLLGDAVIVAGGSATGTCADGEHVAVIDSRTLTQLDALGTSGVDACRVEPSAVRLDDDTAILLGDALEGPAAEVVRRADGAFQMSPLAQPATDPLPALWRGGAATFVACDGGGGVVYVTGGIDGAVDAARPIDGSWCIRDDAIQYMGALPETRARHDAHVIDGPAGPRLLLIGGRTADSSLAPPRTFAVDGCACGALVAEDPPPGAGTGLLLDRSARLADGTVLIVGGLDPFVEPAPFFPALAVSSIFHPDVALP